MRRRSSKRLALEGTLWQQLQLNPGFTSGDRAARGVTCTQQIRQNHETMSSCLLWFSLKLLLQLAMCQSRLWFTLEYEPVMV